MTTGQRDAAMTLTKGLFSEAGGFVQRGKLARLAKGIAPTGTAKIATRKPLFIKRLIDSWPDESTLLWCNYNREQKDLERIFPDAASIAGETPVETRMELLADFHARKRAVMMSKSKILGFGLNLQVATRMVFSSLVDSYESYFQCVKRANRIGSDRDLNVHIPVTEIEQPMVANVLAKAGRVESDTREQEQLFREARRAV